MLHPVILSGGIGSRLWPLSREHYPKQLLALVGEQTMLQSTITRLENIPNLAPPIIVCNEDHRFLVAEQLRCIKVKPSAILLEPVGRNTAPAIALAALAALENDPDAVLLALPADHLIQKIDIFQDVINKAFSISNQELLITFGIVPTKPETGYGYIKAGEQINQHIQKVEEFVEKPNLETAIKYLESGNYFWNSGMFLFKAQNYLDELKQFEPQIFEICTRAFDKLSLDLNSDFVRVDEELFKQCISKSIDFAVMEKTTKAAIIPLDAGWSDIGAWSALWEVSKQDNNGNILQGDIFTENVSNCYLRSEYRLLATLGVENLIVVETADAVLVAHKDYAQNVKNVVDHLKRTKRSEANLHRKVIRPWGSYESIDNEPRFQVKRITVNVGASLSLQMHYHRSEHWIIVKGTAKITRGNEEFVLTENQSTYIPLGVKHRLENPGKIPLEIIEIQSGSYLGEDDIVRFEDHYGRY
jgi:mannose-1-phosphate guanylyltransferase / mannose-6-phosphate isomerase